MPFTETIEFESEPFRNEVQTYSVEKLRVIEKAASRKVWASGLSTCSATVSTFTTGGITLGLAAYKARSIYVATSQLKIAREELERRGEARRGFKFSDMLLGAGPGVVTMRLGIEDIFTDLGGVEGVGEVIGLPKGESESTGLFDNSSAVVDGIFGQPAQLISNIGDGPAHDHEICNALFSGDPVAYHAGQVQASIIEAHIASEAIEALLEQPVEQKPACSRAVQLSVFWGSMPCDLCGTSIKQGPYWRKYIHPRFILMSYTTNADCFHLQDCCSCQNDNWDICTSCYDTGNRCKDRSHTMIWLQTPGGQAFYDRISKTPGYRVWKPPPAAAMSRHDIRDSFPGMFSCNCCGTIVYQGKCFRKHCLAVPLT